jgi:perosamine synthetase
MEIKIPVYKPFLAGNEKKYVNECLDSSWISSKGKFIKQFEDTFADYIGIKYAASVSNGTLAIHDALLALGIKEGDEVIVPTFTYIASVNPIAYTGATPVFVDSLRDTWQIDPADIERKITAKTRAIMVVHLYGHPCDMDQIMAIAHKHQLFVIEDCAEAFGSKYKGQHVGTFGDIAAFSFFGNKTITTGEGGMVATNDRTLHERAVHFKGQGLAKYREYWHDTIGYNYRMTNICAAIGLAQIEKADDIIKKKRQVADLYRKYLSSYPVEMLLESKDVFDTYWMVCILVEQSDIRDSLRAHLMENGIETRPTFYPIHSMPMYAHNFYRLPVAEDISWRGINLPSYPELSENDIKEICSLIGIFYGK